MLSAGAWQQNQPNTVLFVLVDSSGNEVSALGSGYVLQLSKAGAAFAASAGTKSEISSGWYKYVSTAGEADTPGPIAIKITGAGIIQQNLEYYVETRTVGAIEYTYTLTDISTSNPIQGAIVVFSTNSGITNIVWSGVTDTFGIARDSDGNKPWLVAGTYFILSVKPGYTFVVDSEVVS